MEAMTRLGIEPRTYGLKVLRPIQTNTDTQGQTTMPNAHLSTEAHPKTGGARALRGHLWYHLPLCAALLLAGCGDEQPKSPDVSYVTVMARACVLMLQSARTSTDSLSVLMRDMQPNWGSSHATCARFLVEDTTGGRR